MGFFGGSYCYTEGRPDFELSELLKQLNLEKLQKIVDYYGQYEECKGVTKYINFHLESWFICIKFKGVEPTNNYAEQAIRETVMVRKIIGAFRSEGGTKIYEKLASLLAIWRFQQKDLKLELQRMLSANLC